MLSYISLAISSILVSNIVLANFLGICPFLGVSKKKKQAFGMGIAIICVVFFSSLITYGLYNLVLLPLEIEYTKIVVFILVIASLVQFAELLIKKYFPSLYSLFSPNGWVVGILCIGIFTKVSFFKHNPQIVSSK